MNTTHGSQSAVAFQTNALNAAGTFAFQRIGDGAMNSLNVVGVELPAGRRGDEVSGSGQSGTEMREPRIGVLLDPSDVEATALPPTTHAHSIPVWSDRVHRALEVISTGGASLLIRKDEG